MNETIRWETVHNSYQNDDSEHTTDTRIVVEIPDPEIAGAGGRRVVVLNSSTLEGRSWFLELYI